MGTNIPGAWNEQRSDPWRHERVQAYLTLGSRVRGKGQPLSTLVKEFIVGTGLVAYRLTDESRARFQKIVQASVPTADWEDLLSYRAGLARDSLTGAIIAFTEVSDEGAAMLDHRRVAVTFFHPEEPDLRDVVRRFYRALEGANVRGVQVGLLFEADYRLRILSSGSYEELGRGTIVERSGWQPGTWREIGLNTATAAALVGASSLVVVLQPDVVPFFTNLANWIDGLAIGVIAAIVCAVNSVIARWQRRRQFDVEWDDER